MRHEDNDRDNEETFQLPSKQSEFKSVFDRYYKRAEFQILFGFFKFCIDGIDTYGVTQHHHNGRHHPDELKRHSLPPENLWAERGPANPERQFSTFVNRPASLFCYDRYSVKNHDKPIPTKEDIVSK